MIYITQSNNHVIHHPISINRERNCIIVLFVFMSLMNSKSFNNYYYYLVSNLRLNNDYNFLIIAYNIPTI